MSESVLTAFGSDFDAAGLEMWPSSYASGGDDQICVSGRWETLAVALARLPLRSAARCFAERLMASKTKYARYHDDELAGRVLGVL